MKLLLFSFFFSFLKKLPIIVLSAFFANSCFATLLRTGVLCGGAFHLLFSEVRFSSFFLLFFHFGVGINYGNFLIFSPFPFVFVLDLLGA